ncbi:MAG: alpha/beta hydrolase [Candidatus Omnitrophota bacterium]
MTILGCAVLPVFKDRRSVADDVVAKTGFVKEYIKAGDFILMTYQKFNRSSDSVSIYIEGDGRAWENKHQLSDDPTPSNPVALRLAVVDSADNVAYVARPGQYFLLGLSECDSKYWSGQRFSPEVVESFNKIIDLLKEKSSAKNIELIGYSGGGAIAVLVAAERDDVITLRTVGGNLNTDALCAYHHVSQLDGSLNPLDVAQKVAYIPQRHFVGSKDKVVPSEVVESFVEKEGDRCFERITVVEGASHNGGWHKRWKELLLIPLISSCEKCP